MDSAIHVRILLAGRRADGKDGHSWRFWRSDGRWTAEEAVYVAWAEKDLNWRTRFGKAWHKCLVEGWRVNSWLWFDASSVRHVISSIRSVNI